MGKFFYSKAETRKKMQIGRRKYQYLIESEILAKPIKLADEARPVHTEAQIQNAIKNIERGHASALTPSNGNKIKPISDSQFSKFI